MMAFIFLKIDEQSITPKYLKIANSILQAIGKRFPYSYHAKVEIKYADWFEISWYVEITLTERMVHDNLLNLVSDFISWLSDYVILFMKTSLNDKEARILWVKISAFDKKIFSLFIF